MKRFLVFILVLSLAGTGFSAAEVPTLKTADELVNQYSDPADDSLEYQISYSSASEDEADQDLIIVMKNKNLVSFKYCVSVQNQQPTPVAAYRQSFLIDPNKYRDQKLINEIGKNLFNSQYCNFFSESKAYVILNPYLQAQEIHPQYYDLEFSYEAQMWSIFGGLFGAITGAFLSFPPNRIFNIKSAPQTVNGLRKITYFLGHNKLLIGYWAAMGIIVTGGPKLNLKRLESYVYSKKKANAQSLQEIVEDTNQTLKTELSRSDRTMSDLKDNLEEGIKYALKKRFLTAM